MVRCPVPIRSRCGSGVCGGVGYVEFACYVVREETYAVAAAPRNTVPHHRKLYRHRGVARRAARGFAEGNPRARGTSARPISRSREATDRSARVGRPPPPNPDLRPRQSRHRALAPEQPARGHRRFQRRFEALSRREHDLQQSRKCADRASPLCRGGQGFHPSHCPRSRLWAGLQQPR